MSPDSNSSSLEPHNGSAYSTSGRSPRMTSGSSQSRRAAPAQRPRPNHAHDGPRNNVTVNGGVDYIDSQVNGETYDSAVTYAMSPPAQPSRVPSDAYYPESQYYYPSAQFQANEPTMYDNELRLDEEQPQAAAAQTQQHTSYPSGDYYSQQPHGQYHYPHTPVQGAYQPQTPVHNNHQNVPISPTTICWSVEYSAEERLRLGLPRYATEEEIEAARHAYEQVTHQADQAPHSG